MFVINICKRRYIPDRIRLYLSDRAGTIFLYINMSSHHNSSVINQATYKQHVLLFLQIYQHYIGGSELSSRKSFPKTERTTTTKQQGQHSTANCNTTTLHNQKLRYIGKKIFLDLQKFKVCFLNICYSQTCQNGRTYPAQD
jgi:hypothetical protein